ncbi:hypothetical protein TSTA_106800 [Talaromyces stipitatus ATCC 10500]|uniref:F-box domain-containing protein n=1 Tax=Talaromyces stipitatus (strain ATCC 10500 / CBS 375.48 / QM 6759 / NRRL 1006) TaxID=441959 RepID=B8MPN1_TALSN|nr:uncharacterized protein TSTA_106800 [Talaromyces stipitatus ATCC 10500]EED14470.1 hypothetical protein TSTA_106800 [Talaromyces stipitatus ATCC 10500]
MTSDISPFSALPTELIIKVLMELPDLHSIHSLSRASRRVYEIYQDPQLQLQIIRSLILQAGDFSAEANLYSLLQTLKYIIKEKMDGWKPFAENGYEQLLIPFARVLAWSYASNKRKPEAVRLLKKIINQEEPFNSRDSLPKSSLTFLPLRMLLHRLRPKTQPPSMTQLERLREDVPVTEVRPGSVKWDVISEESRQTALSQKEIIFKKDLIMIKCSPRRSTLTAPTIYSMRYRWVSVCEHRTDSASVTAQTSIVSIGRRLALMSSANGLLFLTIDFVTLLS